MTAVTVGERWLEMIKHIITQKNFSPTLKPGDQTSAASSSAQLLCCRVLKMCWCLRKQKQTRSFHIDCVDGKIEEQKNKNKFHNHFPLCIPSELFFNQQSLLSSYLQTFFRQSSCLPLVHWILMISALNPPLLSDASFWPVHSCTTDEGPLACTHIAYIHHCLSTEKLQAHRKAPDCPSVACRHVDATPKNWIIYEIWDWFEVCGNLHFLHELYQQRYCEYFKHFNENLVKLSSFQVLNPKSADVLAFLLLFSRRDSSKIEKSHKTQSKKHDRD